MFNLDAEGRLRSWRDFRSSLNSLPADIAIQKTADLWASAPFVPYYLDSDEPDVWPDPWQLITENYYCDLAKCLGIIYTLALTTHKTALDIEYRRYVDPKTQHVYNLAWLGQGKYIVNLIDREIVNKTQFDKTLQLGQALTAEQLKLEHLL
jgi:hypothetical protein